MTKKHYEAIAKTLRFYYQLETKFGETKYTLHIAETLAGQFAYDNVKFDSARFLQACGIEQ